jgi:hypothetical protein
MRIIGRRPVGYVVVLGLVGAVSIARDELHVPHRVPGTADITAPGRKFGPFVAGRTCIYLGFLFKHNSEFLENRDDFVTLTFGFVIIAVSDEGGGDRRTRAFAAALDSLSRSHDHAMV